LAATAVACLLGADFEAIRTVVKEFRGVEHRLEFVREIRGVEFYNNSKATSVDATAKSLEAFEGGVHLIMGGKDKGAPYAPLRPLLEKRARDVLLIGAAAERIAQELSGSVELVHAGDLATAVREAFWRARPGEVVLLAPACSSFDQFQDFEHRGRVFKELVQKLAEEAEGRGTGKAGGSQVRAAAVGSPSPDDLAGPPESLLQAQRLAQLEPLCIYEVRAEEMAPVKTEPLPSSTESIELGSLEAVQDELLPFESGRAAGVSSSAGQGKRGESGPRLSSERPMKAEPGSPRPSEGKEKPGSPPQSKLPGMD
jgi:Mur ligase-like protein